MIRVLVVSLLVCLPTWGGSFADRALSRTEKIYEKILRHPFNQELAAGTLSAKRFRYYQGQDALYLEDYAKVLRLLARSLEDADMAKKVNQYAEDCLKERSAIAEKAQPSLATISYTSFLLATAAFKSREELAAAVLPCFWIYERVAKDLQKKAVKYNPYSKWLLTYLAPKYQEAVESMIALVEDLAAHATPAVREKMFDAFETSTRMELFFWESAYDTAG